MGRSIFKIELENVTADFESEIEETVDEGCGVSIGYCVAEEELRFEEVGIAVAAWSLVIVDISDFFYELN